MIREPYLEKNVENCLNFSLKCFFFQDGDYVISILAQESERISVAKFQLRSNELENSDSLSVGMISFLTILAISGVYHSTHTSHHRAGGGQLTVLGLHPAIKKLHC